MKEQKFISLVVYAHNDGERIESFLRKINEVLSSKFSSYEVIVVNDGSRDDTLERTRAVFEEIGNGIVINLSRKFGPEIAITAGLDKAMGDFVIEMDEPVFDYPENLITDLYNNAVTGHDLVIAKRSSDSRGPSKLFSRMFYFFLNQISYIDLDLATESCRISSRRTLNALAFMQERSRYRKGMYAYIGFPKKVIHYNGIATPYQRRSRSFAESFSLAFDAIVSFSNVGLKIPTFIGIVFSLFSIVIGIYSVYWYLLGQNISGWTSLILFLSVMSAGIFISLGVIGEYLARLVIESKNRPLYIIKSQENFRRRSGDRAVVTESKSEGRGPRGEG
jgi:dolichol-phosphate mannosyltransferase